MSEYDIKVVNQTSDPINITIFQKPPKSPSSDIIDIAWHTAHMKPGSSVFQIPVPVDIRDHDFYVSATDHPDGKIQTGKNIIKPGESCMITGHKDRGYDMNIV